MILASPENSTIAALLGNSCQQAKDWNQNEHPRAWELTLGQIMRTWSGGLWKLNCGPGIDFALPVSIVPYGHGCTVGTQSECVSNPTERDEGLMDVVADLPADA